MGEIGQRDPWESAVTAQQERLAGLPPRRMLARVEAMAKADAYFRDQAMPDVAISATPNPLQGLWIVGHHNPGHPDEVLVGNGPLVVPTEGEVYMSGSAPPWPEEMGLEEPEIWAYERGEPLLHGGWGDRLAGEFEKEYWSKLLEFVGDERGKYDVYPPPSQTFRAFELTPFDDVKVVILGQDPYPNPGEAHGLAFSVPVGVKKPPSIKNIHAVLESDLGGHAPEHGNLEAWATQGVLLLNTALTVRAGSKQDHLVHRRWRWEKQGWATFSDAVIDAINAKPKRVVFILWGADAKRKAKRISAPHIVITSSHPSPLGAYRGFLESTPFTDADSALPPPTTIDWWSIGGDPLTLSEEGSSDINRGGFVLADLLSATLACSGARPDAPDWGRAILDAVEHVTDKPGGYRVERGLVEAMKSTASLLQRGITPFQGLLEAPRSVAAVYQKHRIALEGLVMERDQLLGAVLGDLGAAVMDQLHGVTWRDLEMLGAVREQADGAGGTGIGA